MGSKITTIAELKKAIEQIFPQGVGADITRGVLFDLISEFEASAREREKELSEPEVQSWNKIRIDELHRILGERGGGESNG